MARIEKLNSSSSIEQYAKVPNKIESELMNVINKYFTSNNYLKDRIILTDADKEVLTQDIMNRLYPVIVNISQNSVAQTIEETVNNLLGPINNVNGKYIIYKCLIEDIDNKRILLISPDLNMLTYGNDIILNINGMEQVEGEHYALLKDSVEPNLIIGIDFYDDLLEEGDIILVKSITKMIIN